MLKICLVATFPPSIRALNEYSYHIAREIERHQDVELTILADILEEDDPEQSQRAYPTQVAKLPEIPGVKIIRCWKFGSLTTPMRVLQAVRQVNPDVVWFNLIFSSFGGASDPFAAFAGLSAPALTRAAGFFTHITLHHIAEHVDFGQAGIGRREKLYRKGSDMATRTLLKAHSVSVLLSDYRRTLQSKYAAQNVMVGTHGTFATLSSPPDFSKRNNPEMRILAFGHWGTYKRLETLMEAFPSILERMPNARLIVAGGNHSAAPNYTQNIRDAQPKHLPIEFLGYVAEKDVPRLFRTSTLLIMPYDSSTGSSGPAHQACEYGLPIVCADIPDFRCMADDDDMAIVFYKRGDAGDLADTVVALLESAELQRQMSLHNFEAGVQMMMATVARTYLRWFELQKLKRSFQGKGRVNRWRNLWTGYGAGPFPQSNGDGIHPVSLLHNVSAETGHDVANALDGGSTLPSAGELQER